MSIIIILGVSGCANPAISQTASTPANSLQPTITAIQSYAVTSTPVNEVSGQATEIPPKDGVWEMLGQVDRDRALADLRKLTGEEPICNDNGCYTISNRLTGSEGLQQAKDYIHQELARLGYSVEAQDWSRSGHADQNLIARKPGKVSAEEEIYFVAHLDGVKNGEAERFPAADDDASGVVDLLELARVLSSHSFSRTVVLFFSTGEEQGSLGVKSYISQLSRIELNSIKYVVDIDMIGYDADQDGVMQLFHGNHAPSKALTATMKEIMVDYRIGLTPIITKGCG